MTPVRVSTQSMVYQGTIESLTDEHLVLVTRQGGLSTAPTIARIPITRIKRVAPVKDFTSGSVERKVSFIGPERSTTGES